MREFAHQIGDQTTPKRRNPGVGIGHVKDLSVVAQDEGEPPSVQIDRHRRQPRLPDDMPADDGVGKPHQELRGHREGGRREKCPEFGTGERHPVR